MLPRRRAQGRQSLPACAGSRHPSHVRAAAAPRTRCSPGARSLRRRRTGRRRLALVPAVGFSLFPKAGTPQFHVDIETPEGTSLAETDRAARFTEKVIGAHPSSDAVSSATWARTTRRFTTTCFSERKPPNRGAAVRAARTSTTASGHADHARLVASSARCSIRERGSSSRSSRTVRRSTRRSRCVWKDRTSTRCGMLAARVESSHAAAPPARST